MEASGKTDPPVEPTKNRRKKSDTPNSRVKVAYVILRNERAEVEGGQANLWAAIGTVEAITPEAALALAVDKQPDDRRQGDYVAVAARLWKPKTVTIEQPAPVVKIG